MYGRGSCDAPCLEDGVEAYAAPLPYVHHQEVRGAGIPHVNIDDKINAQMHKYAALTSALVRTCQRDDGPEHAVKPVDVDSLIHGLTGGVLNTSAMVDETALIEALTSSQVRV